MALTKNISLVDNFGIYVTIPNVYIKVSQTDCNKQQIKAIVEFKKSAEDFAFRKETHRFDHDLTGGNAIKQSYDYLKKLPEFAGSVDC